MDVCGLTPADLASDSIHPTTNDKGTHEIESLRKVAFISESVQSFLYRIALIGCVGYGNCLRQMC